MKAFTITLRMVSLMPLKDVIEVAKASKLHTFIVSLDKGYDTIVGEEA